MTDGCSARPQALLVHGISRRLTRRNRVSQLKSDLCVARRAPQYSSWVGNWASPSGNDELIGTHQNQRRLKPFPTAIRCVFDNRERHAELVRGDPERLDRRWRIA